MTAAPHASPAIARPFTVAIPHSEIAGLNQGLARTRWPDPETVPDWSQGVRLANAQALIGYWAHEYNWHRFEAQINSFPQFLTTIDGLDVHFILVRSKNPNAMPLILTHGWPGSSAHFLRLIGPLTDPEAFGGQADDSFDVVVPTLPAFGFSLALYTGDLGGSNHLQGTKPQTVGYALADSLAGQAAWIYDKYQSKTDNNGLAEDALSPDDMLDVISLYWLTNRAGSSARIYWDNKSVSWAGPELALPVAVTVFPRDIPRLPRSWVEDKYSNLIHYGEAPKGGHFAALEQPEILVSELRTGLRLLRSA